MKNIFCLIALLPTISFGQNCLDLNGSWVGTCDRDGVVEEATLLVRQNNCSHINFYGIDYNIGLPYEVKYENLYERTVNIYNLHWGRDDQSLFFNVDRIKWMKHRNQVSTGEGIGIIKVDGDQMDYSRSYSARNRDGKYTKSVRKCKFIKQ